MESQQTQQTEKLIEEMLGFLNSANEEDNDDDTAEEVPKYLQEMEDEMYESLKEGGQPEEIVPYIGAPRDKKSNYIAAELEKIKTQFPIWKTKEIVPPLKKLNDSIWHQTPALETEWNSKLESNSRSSNNLYVQEVYRALYGDTTGHPTNGTPEYYQAAQNYAIYGKDFHDFPEDLTPLFRDKGGASTPTELNNNGYGNGLYPTPMAPEATTSGMGCSNFVKQSGAYYQHMQQGSRPVTVSTAYGMFLGNKVTYVATPTYNQHSTTTNFISNSLANAALGSSPTIVYSNPMLTTTTQQYLNTFFKETQYLSGSTQGTTTGIYERLVYAQMMLQQQQIYQTQQQAAAVVAMFKQQQQQQQRAPRTSNGLGGGVSQSNSGQAPGLGFCGRQSVVVTNSDIPISGNAVDDTIGRHTLHD